jgi:hypothetical protein
MNTGVARGLLQMLRGRSRSPGHDGGASALTQWRAAVLSSVFRLVTDTALLDTRAHTSARGVISLLNIVLRYASALFWFAVCEP